MTLEEAAEIILAGQAWVACVACMGHGEIPRETLPEKDCCENCLGAGYSRVLNYERACGFLGLEYPAKPFSARERKAAFAREAGQKFRDLLNRPSQLRMLFPPRLITKPDDEP